MIKKTGILLLCCFVFNVGVISQELAYVNGEDNIYGAGNDMPLGRISLDFKNIDIVDALNFLSTKAKINIIATDKVSARVTLTVEDAPIQDVFTIMLRSYGLAYDKRGEIYNVMSEAEYTELYGKKFFDTRKVKVFKLNYAIPHRVVSLCDKLKSDLGVVHLNQDSGTVVVIDTPHKLDEISRAIDIIETKNMVTNVYDLKYAKASDIVKQLKDEINDKQLGSIEADERTNQVIIETLPDRMEGLVNIIEQLDKKTREVLVEVRIVRIRINDNLSKGVEWEGLFQMAVQNGLSYIGSYPFSAVQELSDAWRSRKTVLEGGMAPDGTEIKPVDYVGSYPFSGTTVGQANFAVSQPTTGLGNLHVGMVGHHDVDFIFRYLKTVGDARVVSSPKIAVINNQEARVHIGERQAYITNTTTQTTSATTIAEDVTFIDTGIQIKLTPTINEDGFITIKINPEISNVTSFLTTTQGNRIPIVNTSSTETTVMAKDGSTIFIGGLKEENEVENSEQVPFFSRLPLLGGLFKNSSKTNIRTELLLMVTPHIISGDEITTGYKRDFGIDTGKNDQSYPALAGGQLQEKPRSYPKSYRDYSSNKKESADDIGMPELKPMREIE
jgi:type II secretory pathway component GspD/PulD (secretin)